MWLNKHIYVYTHKQNQNSPTKIKSTIVWPSEQRKPKIISIRTKLNHKLESNTKSRCQLGNKAMKTKLTNILRGKKEKQERIDMKS